LEATPPPAEPVTETPIQPAMPQPAPQPAAQPAIQPAQPYAPPAAKAGGLFTKKNVMIFLMIGVLLSGVGVIYITAYTFPDYDDYYKNPDQDYRDDWDESSYGAGKAGTFMAAIGTFIAGLFGFLAVFLSPDFNESEKRGLLMFAGFMVLALMSVCFF